MKIGNSLYFIKLVTFWESEYIKIIGKKLILTIILSDKKPLSNEYIFCFLLFRLIVIKNINRKNPTKTSSPS